jgi:UPF0288 family protein (methanogenesis marker protein 3)
MSTLTRRTTTRESVPVTEEDAQVAERVREPQSIERTALAELGIELSASPSKAEAFQALIEAGRIAVQQQVMANGYAAAAAAQDDESKAYRRAMRQRPRGSAED